MAYIEYLLLTFLILCAVFAVTAKKTLTTVLIFMSYGMIMSVIWMFLEAPDLAITEAAVGAGINSILLFITLRKVHDLRGTVEKDD